MTIERFNILARSIHESPIMETIKARLRSLKPLTSQEWEALTNLFRQNMPTLYAHITESQTLGTLELHTTILTRLNFRSDDIALLLNISKQHVSNLKGSANKKLFSDGSARTLFRNLCKI